MASESYRESTMFRTGEDSEARRERKAAERAATALLPGSPRVISSGVNVDVSGPYYSGSDNRYERSYAQQAIDDAKAGKIPSGEVVEFTDPATGQRMVRMDAGI